MKKYEYEELVGKMTLTLEDLANVVGGAENEQKKESFYCLLSKKLGVQRADIAPDKTLEELGADSLDVVDILNDIDYD